jgi:ABC-2 type transport system permease protein
MKSFHLHMILAFARKELFHILHDPRTLIIIFIMPVMQLIMFGYALNMEIQNVDIAVVDMSRSPLSREIVQEFRGSRFFTVREYTGPLSGLDALFKKRQARVALLIPADLDQQFQHQPFVPLQFLIDASDANAATLIRNYCNQVVMNFNQSHNQQLQLPFRINSNILFNPDMKSTYFFVPGLIALLLIMLSALLTSISITREKETGTLEQILVSPVRPAHIVLGKVLPYVVMGILIGSLILLIGFVLFQIPFRGSMVLLFLLTLLYILTALSMGILISTVAQTQQVAMMIAQMATMLPTLFLSGFIFPIASMPVVLQYLSYLVPARYYLLIVRGIILKGSTLHHLLFPALVLAGMSVLLLLVSVRKFRMTLEG